MHLSMRQEYIRQRLQVLRFGQLLIPVGDDEMALHKEATPVLEQAAHQVAEEANVPVKVILDRMFDMVFRMEPSGNLLLVLQVPERDVEINVELPPNMWKRLPPKQ